MQGESSGQRSHLKDDPGSVSGWRREVPVLGNILWHCLLHWRDTTIEHRNLCKLFSLLFPQGRCGRRSVAMNLGQNTCSAYLCCSVRLGKFLFPHKAFFSWILFYCMVFPFLCCTVSSIKRSSLLQNKTSLFFGLRIFWLFACTSPEINRFSIGRYL